MPMRPTSFKRLLDGWRLWFRRMVRRARDRRKVHQESGVGAGRTDEEGVHRVAQTRREFKHGYVSILRCSTWCVWPENLSAKSGVFTGRFEPHIERVAFRYFLVSYGGRPRPERSPAKPLGKIGPLVWRGRMDAGYWVGQSFLKAPEDESELTLDYEGPYEGDVDVQIHMESDADIALGELGEIASSLSLPIVSFLNLTHGEFLVPVAPLQIRRLGASGSAWDFENTVTVAVRKRLTLDQGLVETALKNYAKISLNSRLSTALQVYSGYFHQTSVIARFLILIMVLEVLAPVEMKPGFVRDIIERWVHETGESKGKVPPGSAEYLALEALERELLFRREASIRSRVRSFVLKTLQAVGNPDAEAIAKRAVEAYDKRSVLLHEVTLSTTELEKAEKDARETVSLVLKAKIDLELRDDPRA